MFIVHWNHSCLALQGVFEGHGADLVFWAAVNRADLTQNSYFYFDGCSSDYHFIPSSPSTERKFRETVLAHVGHMETTHTISNVRVIHKDRADMAREYDIDL
jgi:hypothetical protein